MRARRPYPPISERDWLTEKEAAERIGVAHSTLRGWRYQDERRHNQRLPSLDYAPRFYKARRQVRYLKTDVAAWIDRHSGPTHSDPFIAGRPT